MSIYLLNRSITFSGLYSSATANHNQAQFLVCIILVQNNELVTGKIDFVV